MSFWTSTVYLPENFKWTSGEFLSVYGKYTFPMYGKKSPMAKANFKILIMYLRYVLEHESECEVVLNFYYQRSPVQAVLFVD